MPLPLILGIAAAVAGGVGVGAGVKGALDMIDAKDTLKSAQFRNEQNLKRHKDIDSRVCKNMDDLGRLELTILSSFKSYIDCVEIIKNRPSFAKIEIDNVEIPKFDNKELQDASVGDAVLLGGIGGAAIGTAGGFAASGATTAAVMALGTASTGAAISGLSGVAATNATLAALGGGSLATGGGGMALGSAILGGATLGVGLLVGGIIFSLCGSKVSDKADTAYSQMLENEKKINKICDFLEQIDSVANMYKADLNKAYDLYNTEFAKMETAVIRNIGADNKVDWRILDDNEKKAVSNTTLLVGLLYHMCKVKLVNKSEDDAEVNVINHTEIDEVHNKCTNTLQAIN